MQSRIVLISDDADFFEYMVPKLSLRKSDELYRFSFNEIPEKLHFIQLSLLIVNGEGAKDKTLDLLRLLKNTPVIVFTYNYIESFALQGYRLGMFDYITVDCNNAEIEAKMLSALNYLASLEKNKKYREILEKNNLIAENNEVFLDYGNIIDKELVQIEKNSTEAVLVAISPNENTKFKLQPNQIETIVLSNIRANDILMNYGINKYFLLLHNTNIKNAEKIWSKISTKLPEKLYAGFTTTVKKSRQQLINDALSKLHEAISKDYIIGNDNNSANILSTNFKLYKQEFKKKLENIITPVFFMIQQKYSGKLFGINIEQGLGDGYGILYIKSKNSIGSFRITSPGLSIINIDIDYQSTIKNKKFEAKRINLEPEELEAGILEDLLEQFISEFKREVDDEYIK